MAKGNEYFDTLRAQFVALRKRLGIHQKDVFPSDTGEDQSRVSSFERGHYPQGGRISMYEAKVKEWEEDLGVTGEQLLREEVKEAPAHYKVNTWGQLIYDLKELVGFLEDNSLPHVVKKSLVKKTFREGARLSERLDGAVVNKVDDE